MSTGRQAEGAVAGEEHRPGPLSLDIMRMKATFEQAGAFGTLPRLPFLLLNSEFHSVACYRLGQYARAPERNSRSARWGLKIVYLLWNRVITHGHHCEISHRATIGPGLLLMHRIGVNIGPATIGKNVVIHQNVTIGQRVAGGDQGVPTIGDNVWIGPGAILSGGITIGDGATISAGTVLSRDIPAGALVGGVPGRVLQRTYDNSAMLGVVVP